MEGLLEQLAATLTAYNALSIYGVGFTVIVVCGLGLPVPEDITLLTMGYMTYLPLADGSPRPFASLPLAIATGFVAVMVGDAIMFGMGRRYGLRIVGHRPFRWVLTPGRIDCARGFLDKHGPKVLFAVRFMPGVRAVAFFTAGALGTPYLRFATFDGLAALISVPFFIWAGWYWGHDIDWAIQQVRHAEHGMLLLIFAAATILVLKALLMRRSRPAAAE